MPEVFFYIAGVPIAVFVGGKIVPLVINIARSLLLGDRTVSLEDLVMSEKTEDFEQ